MTNHNGLKKFAKMMREYAIAHPRLSSADPIDPYRLELGGGLRIVLYVKPDHTWRCSLYREGVYPSAAEVKIIKRDFAIPDDAKESKDKAQRWHLVRLQWKEPEQLFELVPAGPGPECFE